MTPVHEEKYMGRTIKIFSDLDAGAPWDEWDLFGKIVTCGKIARDFNIGHEQYPDMDIDGLLVGLVSEFEDGFEDEINDIHEKAWEEAQDKFKQARSFDDILKNQVAILEKRNVIGLIESRMEKYYVWDYIDAQDWGGGGVRMFFGHSRERASGVIYVTLDDARKEFGKDQCAAYNLLKAETETCDKYLRGDVYGYVVEDFDGEKIDSCWGFYGENPWDSDSHIMQEARSVIEHNEEVALEVFD